MGAFVTLWLVGFCHPVVVRDQAPPPAPAAAPEPPAPGPPSVYLMVPTTTRGLKGRHIRSLPLFSVFLPSLGPNLESDGNYALTLLLGVDFDDPEVALLTSPEDWPVAPPPGLRVHPIILHAPPGALVAAWNLLFAHAVADGADYAYALNDDVEFRAPFLDVFVRALRDRGGVGVVGPRDRRNPELLTMSFVDARVHWELWRQYFPEELENIFSDDWITCVYCQASVLDVAVYNTNQLKTRYRGRKPSMADLGALVVTGRQRVSDYLADTGRPPLDCASTETPRCARYVASALDT